MTTPEERRRNLEAVARALIPETPQQAARRAVAEALMWQGPTTRSPEGEHLAYERFVRLVTYLQQSRPRPGKRRRPRKK